MKRVLLSVLMLSGVLGFSVSRVYSNNNSAPNTECNVCHAEIAAEPAELKLVGLPEKYEPGKTYNLTLTVNSQLKSMSEVQGGFSAEVTAGQLIITDKKNTQLSDSFLTHTQEGSAKRSWKFAWKAPQEKIEANLNIMVVAASGDYSPSGDAIAADTFKMKPKVK